MLHYLCVAGMLSALRPPFPGKNISQPTHYSLLRLKEKRIITVKHLANISGGGTKYHIKATLSMGCRPGLATDASQEPPVTLLIAMKRKK